MKRKKNVNVLAPQNEEIVTILLIPKDATNQVSTFVEERIAQQPTPMRAFMICSFHGLH